VHHCLHVSFVLLADIVVLLHELGSNTLCISKHLRWYSGGICLHFMWVS